MKKPLLAMLGVAGACAACCAIPLAVPLLAGLSAGGLASFGLSLADLPFEMIAGGVTFAMASVAGVALWLRGRQQPKACSVATDQPGSCGCAATAGQRG